MKDILDKMDKDAKKIRKQAGMVFTPPPPSQNYQEVE